MTFITRLVFVATVLSSAMAGSNAWAQIRPSEKRYDPAADPFSKPAVMKRFTSVVNLYTSAWTAPPAGIAVDPFSPGYGFYFVYNQPVVHPYVTLMIGAGVSYTDYRFNGRVTYSDNLDSTYFLPLAPTDYKRNKLSLVFVDMPVELRFASRTKTNEPGWFIAPGFSGGLLINDYVKTTSEDATGHRTKVKTFYTRHLEQQRYGATLRAGFGRFGLFGYYGLSGLFEQGKGTGTNFYQAGITLGGS